jgi:hypothetical protein
MEGSKLDGPWNVPCLEINGETSCLVANGRFQCLVALGRFQAWWPLEGKGKTSFSPPSTFHPIRFYLNLYSIDFKVLFYHGCRALFTYFLPFP